MAAPRSSWKGYLRVSLVSCPVRLYPATTQSERIRFHLLTPDTHNRIQMVTKDPETGKEYQRSELIKGYEFEKDRYVLLDDEDFASARIASSTTMTVDKFIPKESIDPIYFDTCYYLDLPLPGATVDWRT